MDAGVIAISKTITNTQGMAISLAGQLKGCIKRAKRQYYDNQLEHLADNKLWDMVDWTRPRKTTSSVALRDPSTGNVSSDPAELARILAGQFTTNKTGTVNMTLLQELPTHAARDAVPISTALIREALNNNSNSSTPGPDHISWYWLKQATAITPPRDSSEREDHLDPIRGLRDL
jgi:hypothetical protein